MDTRSVGASHSVGWRLRVLRIRHGLTLVEVARAADLDVSYLSRLERDALQNAKPKPDTISRVLDALGATLQEREAVYHRERPALTLAEIEAVVREVGARIEDSTEALFIGDEHWYLHYYNHAARSILAFMPEEYESEVGCHMLHVLIDPAQLKYKCVPDEDRERAFQARAQMFRINFASEEFDGWYQQVVEKIYSIPWAADIWEHPEVQPANLTIGRDEVLILNPDVGTLRFRFQLNNLLSNPRFFLGSWTPIDENTTCRVTDLLQNPKYSYRVRPLLDLTVEEASSLLPSVSLNSAADVHMMG